jgi:hypothetical protein
MDFPANLSNWTPWVDGGSVVAVAVGVAKAFEWFDGLISDESRITLWVHLADVPTGERIDSWGKVFPRLIDKVFGVRALSFKFFLRSCVASVVGVFIVTGITLRLNSGISISYSDLPGSLLALLIISLVSNAVPDYLSLLLSRMIVRLMEKRSKPSAIALLLILDTALTTALALASFAVAMICIGVQDALQNAPAGTSIFTVTRNVFATADYTWFTPISLLKSLLGLDENDKFLQDIIDMILRIFFFSSFFTSVWVWLYVLSIFAIKIANKVRFIWAKLTPYLDIEKKPMQAIGRIAGIMSGAGYALILGIVWASHHWR